MTSGMAAALVTAAAAFVAFLRALTSAATACSSSMKRTFPAFCFFLLLFVAACGSGILAIGEGSGATSVERESSARGWSLPLLTLGLALLSVDEVLSSEVDEDVSVWGASPGTALAVSSAGRSIFQLPFSTTLVLGSPPGLATCAMEDSSKDPTFPPFVESPLFARTSGASIGTFPAAAIFSLDLDSDSRSAAALAFLCVSTDVRSCEIFAWISADSARTFSRAGSDCRAGSGSGSGWAPDGDGDGAPKWLPAVAFTLDGSSTDPRVTFTETSGEPNATPRCAPGLDGFVVVFTSPLGTNLALHLGSFSTPSRRGSGSPTPPKGSSTVSVNSPRAHTTDAGSSGGDGRSNMTERLAG